MEAKIEPTLFHFVLEIVVPEKDNLIGQPMHVFGVVSNAIFLGMWAYFSLGDEYDLG